MFGKALQVITLGGGWIDEQILLRFHIVKEQGVFEIEIDLARIEDA